MESLLGYYGEKQPMNLVPGYGDTNASIHGAFAILAHCGTVRKPGKAAYFPGGSLRNYEPAGEAVMDYNMNDVCRDCRETAIRYCARTGIIPARERTNGGHCRGDEEWQNLCTHWARRNG